MKSLTKLQLFNVDFLYKRKQSAIFILFVHATYVAVDQNNNKILKSYAIFAFIL